MITPNETLLRRMYGAAPTPAPPVDPYDESAARGTGVAAPNSTTVGPRWTGVIGGTRVQIGGLPATATQAEAEEYLRNSPRYQGYLRQGFSNPEMFRALYPNASAADLAAYEDAYKAQQASINWSRGNIADPFGGPLGVIAAFIAAAAGGAALSGGLGAAGAGSGAAAGGGTAAGGAATGGASAGGASSGLGSAIGSGLSSGVSSAAGSAVGAGAGSAASSALGAGSAGAAGAAASGLGPSGGITFQPGGAGIGTAGGGNAGALANSGAIKGGAGVSGLGGLGGGAGTAGAGNMSWMDWVGPLISAGSSIIGGRQANNATEAATRAAIDEQRRQFDLVRSDTAPQRALGAAAVGRLGALSGYGTPDGKPDFSAFYEDPGRAFAIAEGQNAINRSAAARGGLLSGAAVKEGIRYATGMADQQYSAFYDRLLQQAGLGNTGIGASAAAGANAANNIGAATINAGNARASTYMNTAANVNNSVQAGMENYLLRRYLGNAA